MILPRGSTATLAGHHVFFVLSPDVRPLVDRAFGQHDASHPYLTAVEFPLFANTTVADLEEFYGLRIAAPPDETSGALLERRLGRSARTPGARRDRRGGMGCPGGLGDGTEIVGLLLPTTRGYRGSAAAAGAISAAAHYRRRLTRKGRTDSMAEFEGKVALVTGAASGIGRVSAIAYANAGARVVVSDVDEAGALETVRLIREAGGEAEAVRTDVSRPEDCDDLVRRTVETFGRLDCACNNAGIGGESNPVGELSVEGWNKVIGINLSGVFYCMRYEIPAMLANGGGAIVNMASILGAVGFPGASAYVSAKHGVLGLTKNAALEYATQGIRVNAVGPAFIQTPLIAGLEEAVLPFHPVGRLGTPEEVANVVLFLSSSRASFISGSYYPVDGGYLAQ